jgi:hypothetical protein
MAIDTPYRTRFEGPTLIERGRSQLLQCRVYGATGGALSAPSAGTVTIYDQSNTAQVSAAAVTITGSIATYTYAPASTLTLAEGWRVEWALTMGDLNIHTYRNEAVLVRCIPHPNVTEADIYQRCSALNPSGTTPITTSTDMADQIDAAWTIISNRLLNAGNRTNLILSPAVLREPMILLTLALKFEDLRTRLNTAYSELAADYRNQFEAEWGRLKFTYDMGDDGRSDGPGRRSGVASMWLTSRGQVTPARRFP